MNGSSWLQRLQWVKRHTPLTQRALSGFPDYPDKELYICFHIDLKMIPVIEGLAEKVPLKVIACNKSTVDHNGWEHLGGRERLQLLDYGQAYAALAQPAHAPRFLCDLGGELICHALDSDASAVAALEGTTSGISRIAEHLDGETPRFPIIDWNSAPLKMAVHNEKMVGFSVWQTFTEITRLSLHGKTVGILGFGAVGRGIARTARALGGTVMIYDPLPAACTLARFEGFPVAQREELLRASEVVVTATGRPAALRGEDLDHLADGAFLLNAGHGSDELALSIREHPGRYSVLKQVEELRYGPGLSRHCYLLARGELLNLGAGFGDTINGFDLTSAQLIQAVRFLLEVAPGSAPGWQALPADFMNEVL